MPASNKSIRVIMNRYGDPAGEGGEGGRGKERREGVTIDRTIVVSLVVVALASWFHSPIEGLVIIAPNADAEMSEDHRAIFGIETRVRIFLAAVEYRTTSSSKMRTIKSSTARC